MRNKPLVIAHRGYSGKLPENTMAAFHAAITAGAQMIELDVHLSRDQQVVVAHDFELGRTTHAKGKLSDFTGDELRAFDSGSWFSPEFAGAQIPLLEEVLALAKDNLELNIELKEETAVDDASAQALVAKTFGLVKSWEMEEQVVVSSFDWKLLARLRTLAPKLRIGLLHHEPDKGLRWTEGEKLAPFSYHPNFKRLTPAAASEIRVRGLKLYPYTANTRDDFAILLGLEADGIITNEVELLATFLSRI